MKKRSLLFLILAVIAIIPILAVCGRSGPDAPPDTAPPTIASTNPADQGMNVPPNAPISITFDEPVDQNTIQFGLTTPALPGGVEGTMTYNGATAVFQPAQNLQFSSAYTAFVRAGVKDLAGNAMVADHFWSFWTGATLTTGPTHTITATAEAGGSIAPSGAVAVEEGKTASFTITPNSGSTTVTPVGGTCGGVLSGQTYTTNAVTQDCTVSATFTQGTTVTHTVTASAGPNGTISPSGATTVNDGATKTFTVTANSGYHVGSVGGTCGGSLSGSTYTTAPVTANCTVSATFAANTTTQYTVSARVSGGNGSISPSSVIVNQGATASFTVTPNAGYHIGSVTGTCGGSLSGNIYTTGPVTANCAVTASFAQDQVARYTVTASVVGGHGTISPSGSVAVNAGATQTFSIAPSKGYQLVTPVGGTCGGTLSGGKYTTNPINANCTVTVSFSQIQSTVTPLAGPNGTITPSTPQLVAFDSTALFTITPDPAYTIASASGCGGALTDVTYTTGPIEADCTVSATFAQNAPVTYTVTPVAGPNGTLNPSTPQVVGANAVVTFTAGPDPNYQVASVTGCGGTLGGTVYTTAPVTADCTVNATFTGNLLTVTAAATTNGQISPADPQQVGYNGVAVFTLAPADGYTIGSVTGCGGTLAGTVYTTAPVTADCTVTATFTSTTLAI